MFILRPSSLIRPVEPLHKTPEPEPVVEIQADEPREPFIDQGLPVPETYDIDILRALLQDPFHIFIYWEVREESLKSLTHYFSPEDAAEFRTTLKLRDVEGGQEAFFNVGYRGRYWMTVFPDREYEFEIGVRSNKHGYISLLRSNRVRTPRGSISPETDQAAQYRLSPPEFIAVLESTGFAVEQALDITVSAMPGADKDGDMFSSALLKLPEPV